METQSVKYQLKKFDFLRVMYPEMKPTYNHPTITVKWDMRRTSKGPSGRRRKIPPLTSTPYLRYTQINVPASGTAILSPPSWTYWTAFQGILSNTQEVLKTPLGLLTKDPYYGDNCPVVPLGLRTHVESDLLMGVKSQKFNLAVSVAEGKQTLEWMASRTASVGRAYNAFKERDFKKFREAVTMSPPVAPPRSLKRHRRSKELPLRDKDFVTRSLAANWLEYNYAVTPLLLDIYGAAEHMADVVHRLPPPVYRSYSQKEDYYSPEGVTGTTVQDEAGIHIAWTGRCKIVYSQAVYFRVDSAALRQLTQLGITNPALVVWEKTPFSFLFDWLVPVGDYLSGWDATIGCSFVDGYATTHHTTNYFGSVRASRANGRVLKSSDAMIHYRGFVRKPLKTFPYPSFYVRNPFSPRQGATTLALLKSIFFKGK